MSEISDKIDARILKFTRNHSTYRNSLPMELNNFLFLLPNNEFEGGRYFLSIIPPNQRDIPFREIIVLGKYPATNERNSELYKNQTPRQFCEVVDRIIEECRMDVAEIQRLQSSREMGRIEDLYFLTLPVYYRLREMGYSSEELIC